MHSFSAGLIETSNMHLLMICFDLLAQVLSLVRYPRTFGYVLKWNDTVLTSGQQVDVLNEGEASQTN